MTSWSRTGDDNFEDFNFRVKLTSQQWTTNSERGEQPGYDFGGPVHLVKDIFRAIQADETFKAFHLERRATRTMFIPEITINGEVLPDTLTSEQNIRGLALGPQYDMFISFNTKEEMTMFKLTFSGGVGVGFQGIN